MKMVPVITFITTNTFLVRFRKNFVTVYTVFVNTGGTSPWFVFIVFVLFDNMIFKLSTLPVVVFLTFITFQVCKIIKMWEFTLWTLRRTVEKSLVKIYSFFV